MLDFKKYKTADPKQWLIFGNPWQDRIHTVLAGRLAYMASVKKKKITVTSGFRSDEEQLQSQKSALAEHKDYHQGSDGRVYNSKGQCMVSAIGQSSHNWGYAADCDDLIQGMSNSELMQYGLRKPMSYENWHVECIEILSLDQKKANFYLYMEDYPMDIKTFQMITGLKPDGVAGPLTKAKANEVLQICQEIIKVSTAPQKPAYIHEIIGTTHVIRLDPMDLRAKLVKASGKTLAKTEKNFINCNLFNMATMSIIGWLISEGKILSRRDEYKTWKGNPKGTLIVYRDGKVFTGLKLDSEIVKELDKIWFCCQGFNLSPLDTKKEGYSLSAVGYKTNRIMIGFDGKDIVIAYRPDTDAARAVTTMQNLNCKGISLDSELSSNMVLDGKPIITTDRVLPCIVTF